MQIHTHVLSFLGVPVIVVLDVWGVTRTAGALLEGLQAFDPQVNIAGCILNRAGSPTHTQMITDALPARLRPLVLGAIGHHPDLKIPERHLGLVTVEENETASPHRDEAHKRAGDLIDIERPVRIAGVREPVTPRTPTGRRARAQRARIAVARHQAFCFYYEENLLLLRDAGFEIVPFRPTVEPQLPADVDAVYLGGGYPESFAAALAANTTLDSELRSRTLDGMPLYAECGGLMYLGRSLTGFDGVRHTMSGVFPLDVVMDSDHLAISYVEVRTRATSSLGEAGTTVRGQEFHQSRIVHADIEPTLYDVTTTNGQNRRDRYLRHNIVASCNRLHFASNHDVVKHLLRASIEAP